MRTHGSDAEKKGRQPWLCGVLVFRINLLARARRGWEIGMATRGSRFIQTLLAALAVTGTAIAQPTPELTPPELERAERLRQDLRQMVSLARDRVFPALVNIRVITVRYWNGKEEKGQSVGSGTIISPEGYVLTNFHVAENGKRFKCTLSDKQEISGTLVGSYRAGRKILWMMWTLRRPVRQDDTARR